MSVGSGGVGSARKGTDFADMLEFVRNPDLYDKRFKALVEQEAKAEEAVKQARKDADAVLEKARAEAARITESARQTAQRQTQAASRKLGDAEASVRAAEDRLREIQAETDQRVIAAKEAEENAKSARAYADQMQSEATRMMTEAENLRGEYERRLAELRKIVS